MEYQNLSKDELINVITKLQEENRTLSDYAKNRLHPTDTESKSSHLADIEYQLRERIKELECHNKLTHLITRHDLSLNEILQEIVNIIPESLQFPENAEASITVNGNVFKTAGFKNMKYMKSYDILRSTKKIGKIEISYIDETTFTDNAIFLPEEDKLIVSISSRISDLLEATEKLEQLAESESRNISFFINNSSIILLIDPDTGIIIDANPAACSFYGWDRKTICSMHINDINILDETEIKAEMQLSISKRKNHFYFKHRLATTEIRDVEVYTGPLIYKNRNIIYSIIHDITDRVNNEKNLIISEEKYRSIFETIQDAYYEISIDGKILDISPSINKISKGQLKRELLIGTPILNLCAVPTDCDELFKHLAEHYFVNDYEINLKNANESISPVSISATLISDKQGNPLKIIGSIRNIEERKTAENALKSSEEKYRIMFANNPQPMWIYDLETLQIIEVNNSAIGQYGYTREEFLKMTMKDIRPSEDISLFLNEVGKTPENSHNVGVWRHLWKNGEIRFVQITSQLLNFNERKALHVLINDITDRILAEKELLKFRTITDQANYGATITSMEGKLLYVNNTFAKMIGLNTEELLGKNFIQLQNKAQLPRYKEIIKLINLNGGFNSEEINITSKNGLTFPALISAKVIFDSNNIAQFISITIIDITETKEFEKQILKSEKKYKTLFDESPECYLILVDGAFIECNKATEHITGADRSYIIGKTPAMLSPEYQPNGRKSADYSSELIEKTISTGSCTFEWVHIGNTGKEFTVKINLASIDYEGKPAILTSWHDITEIKKTEYRIAKLNRLKLVLSSINQAITKEKSTNKLLDKICKIAVESGKFEFAWIGIVDKDTHLVVPQFIGGAENGYLKAITKINILDKILGNGPVGKALKGGKPIVVNDIENEPIMLPWKDEAMKHNYRSLISLPLMPFGETYAAFNIYSTATNFFTADEISLLEEVIDNINNALEAIVTEENRKKAETELRKLSQAVEQSPVSIVITNLEGNIEYANPKACESTGYSLDELLGKNPRVLQSGETSKTEYQKLWYKISKGDEWHGLFHNKKKNGELYWEAATIAPILNEEGKISHYVAIKEDITLRKKMEQELLQSESALNYAQEIAQMGSWELDLKTNKTKRSANYYRLFGLSPFQQKIPENYFKEIVHPEDLHLLDEKIMEVLKSKKPENVVMRLKMPSGNIKWIQNNFVPVFENNELVSLKGVNIDITELKETEEKLIHQNQRLNAILQAIPDQVFLLNNKGQYLEYYNSSSSKSTKLVDIIGKNLTDFFDTEYSDLHLKNIHESIMNQSLITFDYPMLIDNIQYYYEARLVPMGTKKVLYFVRNITDKKQTEKEIRELNENLEHKIEIRTKELAQTNKDLLSVIAERKKLDEALIASEQSYKTVVENVNEIIFQTDTNGLFVFLNKSWEDISGFALSDAIGQSFFGFVHPDDKQLCIEFFKPVINREKEFSRYQIRFITNDGEFRWIEVFVRLGLNNNNEIIGTYGTLQDITERKWAEDFENEILQLSTKLTGVTLTEIDTALNMALSRIGSFLEADRSYIFEFDTASGCMNNTYESCHEDILPKIDNSQNIPLSKFTKWMSELNAHKNIIIPSVMDLPASWENEQKVLQAQQVQSLIVIPMLVEDYLIGFVGLDYIKTKKDFKHAEINLLKVWSSMISSLISNKRIESLLAQTRQNYETFFNTIDDFLWVLDEQGNIIHMNNTVYNRLEYSEKELLNNSLLNIYPTNKRAEASKIINEMVAGKTEFCPIPIQTKNGKLIPVETKTKKGYWNGNQVIFGVSKDISLVQLSEQKFSSAFQSNSAMMAISDFESGKYVDINNAFAETLGFTRNEVIGHTNDELEIFIDDSKQKINTLFNEILSIRDLEIKMQTKNGSFLTCLLSSETFFIGESKSFLTVILDITLRKQMEDELRHARIEAIQANLAKSEFLSRMSHELRTPMNSILGFAQLLEMSELNNGQRKGVNHIMKSGKHLLSLINEVLDISRIEAGKLSISIEPVRISHILSEMTDLLQPMIHQNHINIERIDFSEKDVYVKADKQSFRQVVLNIINNAIKYNKNGGSVIIKTQVITKSAKNSSTVRISITDTGVGISDENLPKLFVAFERIGADRTNIEGTGLGLAVVKKLIEAMGGQVGVESKIGIGSTFWIELPEAESQIDCLHNSKSTINIPENTTKKEGLILYIEDNDSNIELIEEIINTNRPAIHLISSMEGRLAINLALEHKPDLILLDLNLPDINGLKVMKLLQANTKTKDIPVIIVSADAMQKQIEELMNAGAKKYLTKPLEVEELLKTIDEHIHN